MFRNKWYDILLNVRKEDTPREITLRDIKITKEAESWYDMKEKSVKNLLSNNQNAAPAEKKKAKGKG